MDATTLKINLASAEVSVNLFEPKLDAGPSASPETGDIDPVIAQVARINRLFGALAKEPDDRTHKLRLLAEFMSARPTIAAECQATWELTRLRLGTAESHDYALGSKAAQLSREIADQENCPAMVHAYTTRRRTRWSPPELH